MTVDDRADVLIGRMRTEVATTVSANASRLRTASAPAVVGLLSAAALTPVIAVAGGAGTLLAAGAGVLGSVGANVLTDVVKEAVARLRPDSPAPSPEEVRDAVAERIETAFRAAGPRYSDLRGEVVALFQAVDIAGTALRSAAGSGDADLVPSLVAAFADLTALFGEFAYVLLTARLSLEGLHQELRQEVARQSVDRERARRVEADIGRILAAVRDLSVPGEHPATSSVRWTGCPYRGLLPFEERHAAIFYGRRAATARLADRVAAAGSGLLVVLGPSGAGKSSLLRAGLLATLAADEPVPGCRRWSRLVLTPTADPVRQLATHLADRAGIDSIGAYRSLADRPQDAHLLAGQVLARESAARLVVVVDQLEELFTLVADESARAAFGTAIGAIAGTATVIAGLRADFLDRALAYPAVRDAVEAGPFTVGAMTEADLREAIAGPAAEAGRPVPDELTAAILGDLRDRAVPGGFDSGVLPLLSQVMFAMWWAGDLSVAGYHRAGGVADIVHSSAERVYEALPDTRRDLARRVFVHLADTGAGRLTRRPAGYPALRVAVAGEPAELDAVLEPFTEQRLLTRTDDGLVTIAHEELLRSWSRLRGWLEPSATDRAMHHELADDAEAWRGHGRDPSYLYRGSQLHTVRAAAARWSADPARVLTVDPVAVDFLAAGHRRDRRGRRVLQAVAAVMSLLLVLAAAAAVLAGKNARRADEQHAVALSRQLAAESRVAADQDWLLAQRLATAALTVAPTAQAADAAAELLADYRGILGQRAPVDAVALSPTGHRVAAVEARGATRLWDTELGRPIAASFPVGTAAAAFSPDGRVLATTGDDGAVHRWDPDTGTPLGAPIATGVAAHELTFSGDGRLLATVHRDGKVRLWNPATGAPVGVPVPGYGPDSVGAVQLSPDGRLLAVAADTTVRLWHTATMKPAGSPLPISTGIGGLAFSPDARTLAVGASNGVVSLWATATGQRTRAIQADPVTVRGVAFTPGGDLLVTAGYDALRRWDPRTGEATGGPFDGSHHDQINAMALSADGRIAATAADDATVQLWNVYGGDRLGNSMTRDINLRDVAFSPDGTKLAVAAASEAGVRLWDPRAGRPAGDVLPDESTMIDDVAFSPDGRLLAAAAGQTVRRWDPRTGAAVGEPLTGHFGDVTAVAFSPDGRLLASASVDQQVRLWDAGTGTETGPPIPTYGLGVNDVAFSPDSRLLVTAQADGTVRRWDPRTGTGVGDPLAAHRGEAESVAFSPDGRLLATAGQDRVVRLWDPGTGEAAGPAIPGAAAPVAFSPDGRLLATGGTDGTVRLWDWSTGHPAGVPLRHTRDLKWQDIDAVAFSPDGRLLATAGNDGTVRVSRTEVLTDPIGSLCAQAGPLTDAEWRAHAAGENPVRTC